MKLNLLFPSFLILISVIWGYGQSNSWNNLTPLYSTRTDVEKVLGKPEKSECFWCRYEKEKTQVSVIYARDNCIDRWNVQKDTVLEISVSQDSNLDKSFEELKLDKSKYSYTVDDAFFGTWTNAEDGLQYEFSHIDKILRRIVYIPKKSDKNLRCNGFPPFTPEGKHYPFDRINIHNQDFSKKSNLYRVYALLDNFIVQAQNSTDNYQGFVLIYLDNKFSSNKYQSFLKKIKEHIFKTREAKAEKIAIIEGGLKGKAEIELYLLPKEWKAPAPNPTLPSPQFMKNR